MTPTATVNHVPRWLVPGLAAVPALVLVVFYAWPLVDGARARPQPERPRRHPRRRRHLGSRVVHAVAGGGVDGVDGRARTRSGLRDRPLRLPRAAAPRQRPGGRVRACRRSWSAPPCWLSSLHRSSAAWRRSSRPTCCSTWRSSSAPSAPSCRRCPAIERPRRRPSGLPPAACSARSPCRRSCRRSPPAAAIVFVFTFTSFGVVRILGDVRNSTIEVEIWRQATRFGDIGSAATLTVVQLVAIVVLVGVSTWLQRRRSRPLGLTVGHHRQPPQPGRPTPARRPHRGGDVDRRRRPDAGPHRALAADTRRLLVARLAHPRPGRGAAGDHHRHRPVRLAGHLVCGSWSSPS